MQKLISSFGFLALLAGQALAQAPAAPPAPPPEVKKTVDTFSGNWTVEGTVTGIPGTKGPVKMKESVSCQKAAGGLVAVCTGKGTAEGLGPVQDVLLVTWVAQEKAMHIVGADSMGEFHDHKCAWKDDKTVACDPLTVPAGTVDLSMTVPDAKSFAVTETTTMKDGSKVTFDGKGKKK
jgi:hypothetical protein